MNLLDDHLTDIELVDNARAVLASVGSMALTTLASLLHPWGWTYDMLLRRIHELHKEGLVILDDAGVAHTPAKRRQAGDLHIKVTLAGRQISEGYGLGSYRHQDQARIYDHPGREAVPTGERPLGHTPKLEVT